MSGDERKVATPKEMRDLVAGTPSDDASWFTYGDVVLTPAELSDLLVPHLTPDRIAAIEEVLANRTDTLAVVIEGMVDVGNVSAVMRTADGFGVLEVHTIDVAGSYKRSKRTTQGADKWIDRHRWESTSACYEHLRRRGFVIAAAAIADTALPIAETDLTSPTALVFGNELDGLSREAVDGADCIVAVPMLGFVESFNISVAVAVVLYEAVRQRTTLGGSAGDLDPATVERIRAVWYAKSVKNVRTVITHKLGGRNGGQPSNGIR
ncbi:MAG: RNA methyltransferase [Acidimicrobiia bacterium]|nr:RNA methyltransferase [Acidimicrobiia bacterium]